MMRIKAVCFALGLALAVLLAPASFAQYVRTDLVSNQNGVGANTPDTHLVNSWGLTAFPASSPIGGTPFWLSDNGTGFSTLYDGAGNNQLLNVTIPAAAGSPANTVGTPTGVVSNLTFPANFVFTSAVTNAPGNALFIFATLDGTISAWGVNAPFSQDPNNANATLSQATVVANGPKAGTTYTGLAFATDVNLNINGCNTFLFAADGGPNRDVDIFDCTFKYVMSASDPGIPKDFTPYGIQAVTRTDGTTEIWVTYTSLKKAHSGFVSVFNVDGSLKKHEAVHGPLDSPWGIALAPSDFGPMSNAILISNNIARGRINAFNPNTGAFLGPLRDANGKAIEIDNVWSLQFGGDTPGNTNGAHNQLFFTGGPNAYANGVFGVISNGALVPAP